MGKFHLHHGEQRNDGLRDERNQRMGRPLENLHVAIRHLRIDGLQRFRFGCEIDHAPRGHNHASLVVLDKSAESGHWSAASLSNYKLDGGPALQSNPS